MLLNVAWARELNPYHALLEAFVAVRFIRAPNGSADDEHDDCSIKVLG